MYSYFIVRYILLYIYVFCINIYCNNNYRKYNDPAIIIWLALITFNGCVFLLCICQVRLKDNDNFATTYIHIVYYLVGILLINDYINAIRNDYIK